MQTKNRDQGDGVPLCFSSTSQYRAWRSMAMRVSPGDSQYCTDCTPQFQAERIREFRCAYPGTTFHVSSDGFIDGVRPGCRTRPRERSAQATAGAQP
jgi:hypothetical protein